MPRAKHPEVCRIELARGRLAPRSRAQDGGVFRRQFSGHEAGGTRIEPHVEDLAALARIIDHEPVALLTDGSGHVAIAMAFP